MTEEGICWTCFDENSNLIIILDIFNELEKKKIRTNQNNILARINAGGELSSEFSERILKETLEFAEGNSYVTLCTYKNSLSFRVAMANG